MTYILSTDWHLDDNPANEYRWRAFDHVMQAVQQGQDTEVILLGDIFDRKDRHTGNLVNRFVTKMKALTELTDVTCIMGNHDAPVNGTPYWEFLNTIPRLNYVTKPHADGELLFLPFSSDPMKDWEGIPFELYKAAFMHQTVSGVLLENGERYVADNTSNQIPNLPSNIRSYSGDIHVPQMVRGIIYVGAPHPIKFGDEYSCRMLRIHPTTLRIVEEIPVYTISRRIYEIGSVAELEYVAANPGDQAKVRFRIPADGIEQWPAEQEQISQWAAEHGVSLASVEASVEASVSVLEGAVPDLARDMPEETLRAFSEAEKLEKGMFDAGVALLREGINEIRGE